MGVLSILNQSRGTLPINQIFSAPSDGPACFLLSGSAWAKSSDQTIGVALELDGKRIGTASIFSNGASTHRAVVPSYIPVTLTFGTHKFSLVNLNPETTTDVNDYFDLVLLY